MLVYIVETKDTYNNWTTVKITNVETDALEKFEKLETARLRAASLDCDLAWNTLDEKKPAEKIETFEVIHCKECGACIKRFKDPYFHVTNYEFDHVCETGLFVVDPTEIYFCSETCASEWQKQKIHMSRPGFPGYSDYAKWEKTTFINGKEK